MIRSEHVLASAVGLLLLTMLCLGMVIGRCPNCGPHGLAVWVVGILVTALSAGIVMLVLTIWRTQRLWQWCCPYVVPHSPPLQQVCQRLGIASPQIVCIEQLTPLAFCIGFLRPRIVISSGLLAQVSPRELMAILAHEHHHQQRRDPLRLLVVRLVRVILYPLPVIHDVYRAFLILLEIEADKTAAMRSGRPALAAALYKLFTQPDPGLSISRPGTVALFSGHESRLAHLLDSHQAPALSLSPSRFMVSLTPFLLLCATMLFS